MSIPASGKIREAIAWMRQYVGEGINAEMRWDRSGAQSFPLLSKGDWSALALFGAYGHIEVSATGAQSLPVQSLGFGYRVAGDDFDFDLDRVTIRGLGKMLAPTVEQPAGSFGATPSQFGIMSLLTILSIIRGIWSLLNPTCDLLLGGNVSASAVLNGDSINVAFSQCPSVKLVALFTFQLSIESMTITDSNIHVEFGGSRWVKSRDFKVT